MPGYLGVDGLARAVSKIYVGVDGVARKGVKGYIGVGGVARLFYARTQAPVYHNVSSLSVARHDLSGASVGDYALFAGGYIGPAE